MSREQKFAWYLLAVFGLTAACVAVVWALAGAAFAPAALGVFGLGGLAPLLFRKAGRDAPGPDERDRMIAEKATLRGAIGSYGGTCIICTAIWCVQHAQGRETMHIQALMFVPIVAMVLLFTIRSIVLLTLYARGGADG